MQSENSICFLFTRHAKATRQLIKCLLFAGFSQHRTTWTCIQQLSRLSYQRTSCATLWASGPISYAISPSTRSNSIRKSRQSTFPSRCSIMCRMARRIVDSRWFWLTRCSRQPTSWRMRTFDSHRYSAGVSRCCRVCSSWPMILWTEVRRDAVTRAGTSWTMSVSRRSTTRWWSAMESIIWSASTSVMLSITRMCWSFSIRFRSSRRLDSCRMCIRPVLMWRRSLWSNTSQLSQIRRLITAFICRLRWRCTWRALKMLKCIDRRGRFWWKLETSSRHRTISSIALAIRRWREKSAQTFKMENAHGWRWWRCSVQIALRKSWCGSATERAVRNLHNLCEL